MGQFVAFEWLRLHKRRWLRALLFLLLWLMLLDFPHEVTVRTIDANWMRCLGYFLVNRYQCGVDYVWTYGPLGYFPHHIYYADLFWYKYAWEIGIKFALAGLLLRWADLLRRGWARTTFLILALFFFPRSVDALYLFSLVLLGLLPLRDPSWQTSGRLAAAGVLLAILSLTKFTFLLLGSVVWITIVLTPSLNWQRRSIAVVSYPLVWTLAWLLLGQSLGNIPHFLSSSWEIVHGYSEAMALEGSSRMVYTGLAALVLFFALLASCLFVSLRPWRSLQTSAQEAVSDERRSCTNAPEASLGTQTEKVFGRMLTYLCALMSSVKSEWMLGSFLLSISMFLVWKHGFIRQDNFHLFHFFGYLLFTPFTVEGFLGEAAPKRMRAALATTLIILGALCRGPIPRPSDWLNRLHFNGLVALAPLRLKYLLDKQQAAMATEWALPNIQRLVREEPSDLISTAQGVLLLNQLHYRPRPIFQSYSAYTPALSQRNAAFYRSERAPTFVLCRLSPIDGRFPALEDGLALLELFCRYRPVTSEKGFLLLKRRTDAQPSQTKERPVLLQRTVAFEEEVRLDNLGPMPKLLSVRITHTLFGRLRVFLFRSPTLFLKLHTRDGGTYSYRLIPGMASSDFLLDPLLRQQADIEAFYKGKPLPRIQSFSVSADPDGRSCFRECLEITVRGADDWNFYSVTPQNPHSRDKE